MKFVQNHQNMHLILVAKFKAPDSYADSIGKVNVLSGISKVLTRAGRGGGIEVQLMTSLVLVMMMNLLMVLHSLMMVTSFSDCATTNANPNSQADITQQGWIYLSKMFTT